MKAAPEGVGSTYRGLTHSLDSTKEQAVNNPTRTCAIDGCASPTVGRGWCNMHYKRWRRGADLNGPRRIIHSGPPEERFWARVDRGGPGGCWLWTGGAIGKGYGFFGVDADVRVLAHRFAWELLVGAIPDGMLLDHRCHVRRCVNPEHLRVVTNKQNLENRQGASRNSRSGVLGVYQSAPDRWIALVGHNGEPHRRGPFGSLIEAEAAARELRNRLFTHNDADRGIA